MIWTNFLSLLYILPIEANFGFRRWYSVDSRAVVTGVITVKAQENDEGGPQADDNKSFYAALEFWIQVAVVILTFGFVDAG